MPFTWEMPPVLTMDYAGRFTVELPYGADLTALQMLRYLQQRGRQLKIKRMTGTIRHDAGRWTGQFYRNLPIKRS